MKKIAFDDKFNFTDKVIWGDKTQVRVPAQIQVWAYKKNDFEEVPVNKIFRVPDTNDWAFKTNSQAYALPRQYYPRYNIGEIVAVAESYKRIFDSVQIDKSYAESKLRICKEYPAFIPEKSFCSKRWVKPELMPYQIKITDVRIERVQDISEEDSLVEGLDIIHIGGSGTKYICKNRGEYVDYTFNPRVAYEFMYKRIYGAKSWESNPWVWVYEFEIVR